MSTKNIAGYSSQVLVEIIIDIVYFPIWWYSKGLIQVILAVWEFLSGKQKGLGFFVWLKNIGRPMYGQTDAVGVIISLFIRSVQIIVRGVILLFWVLLVLILLFIWLFLPLVVMYEIIFQLSLNVY